MKFLVDECTGSYVSDWLIENNFETFSVINNWRGATDVEILDKCVSEDYVLITSDKDFGELIFNQKLKHKGVVFLRCNPDNFTNRILLLDKILKNHISDLLNNFIVANNDKIRIIKF